MAWILGFRGKNRMSKKLAKFLTVLFALIAWNGGSRSLAAIDNSAFGKTDLSAASYEAFKKAAEEASATMLKAASEHGDRKIASESALSDVALTQEFRDFRNKFLDIQTASQLDDALAKLDAELNVDHILSMPPDLRYAAISLQGVLLSRAALYGKPGQRRQVHP
jgi:hypothetical protein